MTSSHKEPDVKKNKHEFLNKLGRSVVEWWLSGLSPSFNPRTLTAMDAAVTRREQ